MRRYEHTLAVEAGKIAHVARSYNGAQPVAPFTDLTVICPWSGDEKRVAVEWGWMNQHKANEHSLVGGWLLWLPDGNFGYRTDKDFKAQFSRLGDLTPTLADHAFFKEWERLVLERIIANQGVYTTPHGRRWLAIGKTHIEEGIMALTRALFGPKEPK